MRASCSIDSPSKTGKRVLNPYTTVVLVVAEVFGQHLAATQGPGRGKYSAVPVRQAVLAAHGQGLVHNQTIKGQSKGTDLFSRCAVLQPKTDLSPLSTYNFVGIPQTLAPVLTIDIHVMQPGAYLLTYVRYYVH